MEVPERRSARALVLCRARSSVLLLRFAFPWRDVETWITPGGGIEPGEDARAAVVRELYEETGLVVPEAGPEIWTRDHALTWGEGRIRLLERYFLFEVDEFAPRAVALAPGDESDMFRGFRWWPVAELPDESRALAPRRLGALVRELLRDGPPARPFAVPV
jgi:8-oxo-dGTP pyrophosphatase MutT (NUDIX family)